MNDLNATQKCYIFVDEVIEDNDFGDILQHQKKKIVNELMAKTIKDLLILTEKRGDSDA